MENRAGYKLKTVFFTMVLICSLTATASMPTHAVEADGEYREAAFNRGGFLIPEELMAHQNFISEVMDRHNAAESFRHQGFTIKYNDDHTIASVTYNDGTIANYSYKRDEDGRLISCEIDNGRVRVAIVDGRRSGYERQDSFEKFMMQEDGDSKQLIVIIVMDEPEDSAAPADGGQATPQDAADDGQNADELGEQDQSLAYSGTTSEDADYYDETADAAVDNSDINHADLYSGYYMETDSDGDGYSSSEDDEIVREELRYARNYSKDRGVTGPVSAPKQPPETRPDKTKPVVIVVQSKTADLQKIAKRPVNIIKIEKLAKKVAMLKISAMKEYERKTARYYDVVRNELDVVVEPRRHPFAKTVRSREEVDRAVAEIRASARKGSPGEAMRRFLDIEKELRSGIVDPARSLCEARLAALEKYISETIDDLNLSVETVVYLGIGNDEKIEALIDLEN